MELSNDAKRIKEMCERKKSFAALQVANEDDPAERLTYIRALSAFEDVLDFIERMEKEKELLHE